MVNVDWGSGNNSLINRERMANLEEYASNYLSLLDKAGVKYAALRVETPGGGSSTGGPFWDYVVSYSDYPEYPGTMLAPHTMLGTDPSQLMSSSLGDANAAKGLKQANPEMWANTYGNMDDRLEAQGLPRELDRDPTYDTSYTYNAKLGPNGLYGTMNPNRIAEFADAGMGAGYDVPPPTFGTPPADGNFPTANPVEWQPLPPDTQRNVLGEIVPSQSTGGSGASTAAVQPGPATASAPTPSLSGLASKIQSTPTTALSLWDWLNPHRPAKDPTGSRLSLMMGWLRGIRS